MARHIMAVCVVCLLCAEHLPCHEHFETIAKNLQLNAKVFQTSDLAHALPEYNAYRDGNDNRLDSNDDFYEKPKSRRKSTENLNNRDTNINSRRRRKRHSGHDHDDHSIDALHLHGSPEITQNFLKQIFSEYGQNDGTMDMQGFERMLNKLGLLELIEAKATVNDSCITNHQLVSHIQAHQITSNPPQTPHKNCSSSNTASSNSKERNSTAPCDQANEQKPKKNFTINTQDIFNLCPILLYQLAGPTLLDRQGCINDSLLASVDLAESAIFEEDENNRFYVWIYSFISVFACGILGLVGVAIIPCMDTRFYKEVLQFFVALAVGTMTGDALLHLLPHSVAGESETGMIYKGLTCMGGIIFFYAMEHGLTAIAEWRKTIEKKEKNNSRARVTRDPDSSINNSVAGDKLCKSKYSSYPYCYDEIAMDTKNDTWLHQPNKIPERKTNNCKENGGGDMNETAQSLLSQQNYMPVSELGHIPDSNTISTNLDESSIADGNVKDNKEIKVILREHETSHHGHSHKHGHVHSPPESLSAVAWMIILGDGLHNFTDGLAIGAAFSDNIAGGFSTSLAVFCHELPHELGDFAILIKAGMSAKSAVYYNLLTGILSFIGMIFGIIFGQSEDTAKWMFAAAAGLFIYIALVDMMPELSTAHKSFKQCSLQILGMFTGLMMMLVIALYEHDLMHVFSPNKSGGIGHSHTHH